MNKSDYDKYYKKGGTYVIPVELFNELYDELERQTLNYEQALEDLDKKENITKEIREKIKEFCWDYDYETYSNMTSNEVKELVEILDKVEE